MFIHIDTTNGYKVIAHYSEINYVPEFAEFIRQHGWNCFQYLILFSSPQSPFSYLELAERNKKVVDIVKRYPMAPDATGGLKRFHQELYTNSDYKEVEKILNQLTFDPDKSMENTLVRMLTNSLKKLDDINMGDEKQAEKASSLLKQVSSIRAELATVRNNIQSKIRTSNPFGFNNIALELDKEQSKDTILNVGTGK